MSLAIFCRLRVATTVALKFIDDLALTQKVPLAVADMTLNVGEVIEKLRHARHDTS